MVGDSLKRQQRERRPLSHSVLLHLLWTQQAHIKKKDLVLSLSHSQPRSHTLIRKSIKSSRQVKHKAPQNWTGSGLKPHQHPVYVLTEKVRIILEDILLYYYLYFKDWDAKSDTSPRSVCSLIYYIEKILVNSISSLRPSNDSLLIIISYVFLFTQVHSLHMRKS